MYYTRKVLVIDSLRLLSNLQTMLANVEYIGSQGRWSFGGVNAHTHFSRID